MVTLMYNIHQSIFANYIVMRNHFQTNSLMYIFITVYRLPINIVYKTTILYSKEIKYKHDII